MKHIYRLCISVYHNNWFNNFCCITYGFPIGSKAKKVIYFVVREEERSDNPMSLDNTCVWNHIIN